MALHPGERKHYFPGEVPVTWDPIRRALEEDADWYRDLIEHSHDLLCIHDLEGHFLSVNPVPARLLGYTVEEMLGKPMRDFVDPQFRAHFDVYLREIVRIGESRGLLAVLTRTGERRIWEYHNTLRTEGVDRPIVRGIAHDVTDRVRAEKALRASNEQLLKTADERERTLRELTLFRTLLDKSHDAIQVIDPETLRVLDVNERACLELGYSRDELLSMTISDIDPCVREDLRVRVDRQIQESGFAIMETVHRRKDGTTFPVEVTLQEVRLDRPYVVAVARDITERKRAQDALRRSEESYRMFVAQSSEGIFRQELDAPIPVNLPEDDLVHHILHDSYMAECNDAMAKMYGLNSVEELVGQRLTETLDPNDPNNIQLTRDFIRSGFRVLERESYEVDMQDNPKVFLNSMIGIVENGHLVRTWGIQRDVTEKVRLEEERKRAEAALRESEARERARATELETVLDAVPVAVCIAYDASCQRMTGNRAAQEQLRLPGDRNISKSAQLNPQSTFRLMEDGVELSADALPMQQAAATGKAVYGRELTVMFEDGTERETVLTAVPLLDEEGRPRGAVGASIDLTELKQAEKALRESELRFRTVFERSPAGIALVDSHSGRFLQVNPKFCEIAGRSEEELLRIDFRDITHPDDIERQDEYLRLLIEEKLTGFELEKRYLQPDGSMRWARLQIVPMWKVGESRRWHVTLVEDITERKRTEEALRQSEERFRVALKHAPITVFSQDQDLRYTWVYKPQLPYTPEEIVGKTTLEVFEDQPGRFGTEVRRRVLETGVGTRYELQVTAGGRKQYFDVTIEPVFDAQDRVTGLMGAAMGVTELREAIEGLREAKKKLTEEKLYLEKEIDTELGFGEIIGRSKALQAVMEQVGKVAASDATVLLLGETGTGKELVARAIHRMSRRAHKSFIKLNCAAIPSGLLESELFGNEKGAFTGAVSKKVGRVELADKGTLFLDEIGEISLVLQPKLLRVLQDQEFERLGGVHTLKVDFRLIAATNRDLEESVREHEFRSDLYYRLNVFPIRVPPLRERREDIQLLAEYFVQRCARRMKKTITSIPKKTMDALVGWEWPGNVRELENFIERSAILTQGTVLVSPLSELRPIGAEEKGANETLEATEREHILRALRESHGQIGGLKGAAMRLGLKRTTLQSKLKHLGINARPAPTQH